MKSQILVAELREILKVNRAKHKARYKEAMIGYRKKTVKLLEGILAEISNSGKIPFHIALLPNRPEDHTKDYDNLIAMLKLHTETHHDTIEIDQHEYDEYVNDNWCWKSDFSSSCSSYTSTSSRSSK